MRRSFLRDAVRSAASGGLAAPLQKHVEGVHHALAQVGGAPGRQQGAEFEGFGDAVLVDVRQHVLIPLATQDDLGVVVVKVDLRRWKMVLLVDRGSREYRKLTFF